MFNQIKESKTPESHRPADEVIYKLLISDVGRQRGI